MDQSSLGFYKPPIGMVKGESPLEIGRSRGVPYRKNNMAFPEYIPDTDHNSVVYLLTSVDEIHLELSRMGEILHTDDLNPVDIEFDTYNSTGVNRANYITQLVQRASSHVMSKLGNRFAVQNVYRIPRIREIATYWACYKLSGRRGNPKLYEEEYIEAMEDLDGFSDGSLYLDAPTNGQRAIIQSYIIDNRYSRLSTRLVPEGSVGIKPGQPVVYRYPFSWL